jgi:hypothetical protein
VGCSSLVSLQIDFHSKVNQALDESLPGSKLCQFIIDKYAWYGTSPGSKLRQFIIDKYAWYGTSPGSELRKFIIDMYAWYGEDT